MTLQLKVGKHYRILTERISNEDLPVRHDIAPALPAGLTINLATGLVTGVVTEPPTPIIPIQFWRDRTLTLVVS